MLTMRTAAWLLFSPLVVIALIKNPVPRQRLLNVNISHVKGKSHIKTFSSEIFGKLHFLTLSEKELYVFWFFELSIREITFYA